MTTKVQRLAFALIALTVVGYTLVSASSDTHETPSNEIAYSDVVSNIEAGKIREVLLRGPNIFGQLSDGQAFHSFAPDDPTFVTRLIEKGVHVIARPEFSENGSVLHAILGWLPMIILGAIWFFGMQSSRKMGGGGAMSFGRSKARLMSSKQPQVTFDDVAGIDEAKSELSEIVDFLREPMKFQKLGGKIPKGVLLVGPPGTGKTLLARAIAGEADVPFFTVSGSDFVEMFVGVGASRVRDMFEQAKKNAPCIVFIDEIDAVGRHRGAGVGGGNDEREQTLNQMLVEMDGFESNEGVILIAATNRPDVLDPALLRPGRFDRQVFVPNPDVNGREKVLRVHLRKVPMAPDVDARVIARGTPGFSGADLANLVNEAALLSARLGRRTVAMAELEAAKDKVMMGAERRSLVMSDAEKRMTAYHEAGHALVAIMEPECDPVHKATIIPRGGALGLVLSLPEGDRYSKSRAKLIAEITMAMGGRAAEEVAFGPSNVSSGASGDIKMATGQARRMVTEWGMSDKLGMVSYGDSDQEPFIGGMMGHAKSVSQETARLIDMEIKAIVDASYAAAMTTLRTHVEHLHAIAAALLKFETLTGREIQGIAKIQSMVHSRSPEEPARRGSVPTLDPRSDDLLGSALPV